LKPLLYLELRQFANSVKNTARSPRRLIPALIIAACFFSCLLNTIMLVSGAARPVHHGLISAINAPVQAPMIRAIAFLLLCFGSLAIVFQAFSNGSMVFSIAHIDFLFPTPIPRRSVLLIKLLKDYLKYLFWIAFFVVLAGIPAAAAMNLSLFPSGLISIAALTAYLLFVVNLAHTANIIFTFGYEKLKQIGTIIKIVLGFAVASAILLGAFQYANTGGDCYLSLLYAADSPFIKTIFAPANWCAGVALAPIEPPSYTDLGHLALLWVLAVGSFLLLMSRKENIYEPSLGISSRMTKMRQAMKAGDATALRVQMMSEKGKKSAGWLVLPPFGRGAISLFWKGILTRYRMSVGQMITMVVLPGLVCYLLQHFVPLGDVLRYLPVMLVYLSFVLSITVQPQVRAELKHANILKGMPIAPWKIVAVLTISGAAYLAAGILVFAGWMWLLVPLSRDWILGVCAIGAPFLGFACISMTVMPALMYPDMRDSAQNFFCNFIGFMLIAIPIVPTAVLGVVLFGLWNAINYPYLAMVPLCLVNVLLGAGGIAISGAIFRKFDPTSE